MATEHLTHQSIVQAWECDHMGHMNVRYYMHKFDDAGWVFLAMVGLNTPYIRKTNIGPVAVDHHIQYKRERMAGDSVTVHSQILKLDGKKLYMRHTMRDAVTGEEVATCDLTGLFFHRETRRAVECPPEIMETIQGLL